MEEWRGGGVEGWRGGGVEVEGWTDGGLDGWRGGGWRGGGMEGWWLGGGLDRRWVLGMVLALPPALTPQSDSVWPISSAHLVFCQPFVYRTIMRIFSSFFRMYPDLKGPLLYGFF